ncbi:MAG: DUF1223 domain-containing protein [Ginsengibacter sp.]
MKKLLYVLFLLVPLFTLWFCTSSSGVRGKEPVNSTPAKTQQASVTSVAVLELFTSQGCSSCPSADMLLEDFSHKESIIILSFHVDYWKKLGWKDPYSSPENTQRQYKYTSALKSSVYTPQLVVNGESEMVGSDVKRIEKTLKEALARDAKSEILIEHVNAQDRKVMISYTVRGNLANYLLNIALVEKNTVTSIRSGENTGVTLNGTNVVRNFKNMYKIDEGINSAEIDIPSGIDSKNLRVVLYLQEKNNNKILTAAKSDIT